MEGIILLTGRAVLTIEFTTSTPQCQKYLSANILGTVGYKKVQHSNFGVLAPSKICEIDNVAIYKEFSRRQSRNYDIY